MNRIINHLLLSGQLNDHLIEIDIQANRLIDEAIKHLAKEENCDDTLKKKDPLQWYGLMLNYKKCAEEIVLKEIVYRK